MIFIVWILTFLLIVTCGVLILLVLVQLPKKDAGAGLAFGGGAADALFGAGSGNALTKITKWAIVVFVLLTVGLGSVEVRMHSSNASQFEQGVEQQQQAAPQVQPTVPAPTTPSSAAPSTPAMPLYSATNSSPQPATTATTNGK